MYVISPWSRGGFVNSEVFDHTSVIRFLEQRFGVAEPNLSPWRRAVCGDLTSAFDFRTPNDTPFASKLPKTAETAARAAALRGHTTPLTPDTPATPEQAVGVRPSRALPYDLDVAAAVGSGSVELTFRNAGAAGAVFHVYDRARLQDVPRRYTVEAGKTLKDAWSAEGGYDLWVLGPNGFHRHFAGAGAGGLEVSAVYDPSGPALTLTVSNTGEAILSATVAAPAYGLAGWRPTVAPGASASRTWSLQKTGGWYDLALSAKDLPDFRRRLAGRVETGRNSVSDPAMGGPALMEQSV
jgi:phospholipase C